MTNYPSNNDKVGKVTLVGFGPGDPELLTIKAVKALEAADSIFYDDLITKEYLQNFNAEKVYVGKRSGHHHKEQGTINQLLVEAAQKGQQVVRLKGGDPMIFAHASEEIAYLESFQIPVEVVPGITTASALAASLKVSLTHRSLSSSVALVNGHAKNPQKPTAETLVYYMGASKLQGIAESLLQQGRYPDTAVALVYNVSYPDEQRFETTLEELTKGGKEYPTPLIALIGDVAALRHQTAEEILAKHPRISF